MSGRRLTLLDFLILIILSAFLGGIFYSLLRGAFHGLLYLLSFLY